MPQPPHFGDGESKPVVSWRGELPVAPGPDGTWALYQPATGVLGQGTVVARPPGVRLEQDRTGAGAGADEGADRRGPRWTLELPAEFALTSKVPGTPHSALVRGHTVLLVGGRPDRVGPTAVAGLDPRKGVITWRREVAGGTSVSLDRDHGSGDGVLIEATCAPGSCRVEGSDPTTGRSQWERTVPGAGAVLHGCGRDGLGTAVHDCGTYVVADGRIARIEPREGGVLWAEGLRLPEGRIDRVGSTHSSWLVVVTAPEKGTCRASVAAGSMRTDGDRPGWRADVTWDQPEAARDPGTGCRWDRTGPLLSHAGLVVPDAEGARVVRALDGPAAAVARPRLEPGEYLLRTEHMYPAERTEVFVHGPNGPDHAPEDPEKRPVRPAGLGPGAAIVDSGVWQDGSRLLLFGNWPGAGDRILWKAGSACRAHTVPGGGLRYCRGNELVLVVPKKED
ncbi:hypothetical protein [Streptomyces sp. NPDC051183]|uniref:hypothetical protein n=1 Tax=Streptomyces sp. NPDC051183 TaxID=3155165 RepID=UPI003430D4A1